MSKEFRPWKIDETQLLPPSVQDYVPRDHVSRLIVSLVKESLDLSAILGSYRSGLGQPPFDPRMMTALLLHGYASGIYSSRRIARAAVERADFMMIVAGDAPDFRTISEFRRRHLKALADLFVQVLKLAEKAGLVKLGHVALDGTKIKANASKHKAMSYDRMKKREAELAAEVDRWLKAAEAADAQEDKLYGDKRGDEMPDWVADKQKRLEKIREAKAALEAEAKAAAEAERKARAEAEERRIAEGGKKNGKTSAPPNTEPDGKAQRNFTDPESRILKTKDGYIQGYNTQAAVDGAHQIIVAQTLTSSSSDQAQLAPLLDGIRANLGTNPDEVSADAGYCSAANLRTIKRRRIEGYIATGRQKHGTKSATAEKPSRAGSLIARMSTKLKRAGYRSRYRLRKQIVEPVFGQIKQARGFRQFLLRGIDKVKPEWALICTAHNLVKLARAA
ncbi:IS1182 family transposase [Bradyrhizobium sp. sBnM-33]|uniref:IS1182 family transposase n=1 Tax=Bradyrhizobium sp. sBnM-33 TaxID=2831780 RepID=UPI00293F4238|nr:IS1182 family transposase [Bradyrhizobium sp. sBnM-33]WOH52326.1 IS1182 family transposase [Bradyrhizobium sp. sBnM-33]